SDAGLDTDTGGRVKRVERYVGDDETFCVTYGDGLADIDLHALLEFHRSHGRAATLTAVHPRSNFGLLKLDGESAVTEFEEKPVITDWINGGFFVFERKAFNYLDDDCALEREAFRRPANERPLMSHRDTSFLYSMGTCKG